MKWLRWVFFCRFGKHRLTVSVDHASLTMIGCTDCGRRFRFSALAQGTETVARWKRESP
jgi:hypothetical protein